MCPASCSPRHTSKACQANAFGKRTYAELTTFKGLFRSSTCLKDALKDCILDVSETGNKDMKKLLILLFAMFAAVESRAEQPRSLVIFHTNDIHGHFLPERATWRKDSALVGGAAT